MVYQEIQIVQNTWFDVTRKGEGDIGVMFYTRLFANSPELKAILKNDIPTHSKRFIRMLSYMINKLEDANLMHEAKYIISRYPEYQAQYEHYECMKEALFWALRNKLADKWTPRVMVSWIWFFSILSYVMKDTGREKYA